MSLTYESLSNLVLQFSALSCFPDFTKTPVGEALADYLTQTAEAYDGEWYPFAARNAIVASWKDLAAAIYQGGGDLGKWLSAYLSRGDSYYLPLYLKGAVTDDLEASLQTDLAFFDALSALDPAELASFLRVNPVAYQGPLPTWQNTRIDAAAIFADLLTHVRTRGYGIFKDCCFFKVKGTDLVPIPDADIQTLDQLYGFQKEREKVLRNTAALAAGEKASNVLLYGDAGTGKSTTVKACAAAYFEEGVRLIEFNKDQVSQIPDLAESLRAVPLRFILFIDDLTFAENDSDYYALKGILEGNVSGTGNNIAIYATSNRRHLVKESMSDRDGSDLHVNDTLQETMSLSSRFGLTITFQKPAKDEYLMIMENLAREYGLLSGTEDPEVLADLDRRAEAFAIRANGRSPRTAKQFVTLAKNGLA